MRRINYFRKTSARQPLKLFQTIFSAFTGKRPAPAVPQHRYANQLELEQGQPYQVIKEFTDYDREVHPVGERWTYVGTAFLPYEDGLSLFVVKDGVELMYRLQLREEEQAGIINNFKDFVERC